MEYALKMIKKKSSKKRSTKKTRMKPSLADNEYQDNANINPDLPLISMNEPSPHSSDNSTSEAIPFSSDKNDYDIDPIDIDNDNDDNDDLNYDVDDGGFGFDDFMNNAMETPWRKTPNSNNENNNISKKKQVVSKKDNNKGKSSKDDLISMVERARLKLGRQDNNVDDVYTQPAPSKVKSVPTVAVPKVANEFYDDNTKSSVSLNANLPLNMFLKAGPVRPFLRQSNESIKTSKKKKKPKIVTEPIITTNTATTSADKNINIDSTVGQDDKENVVNKLNTNITKSNSTKRKYLNASNIKYAFDYVQPNSKATNDDDEEEEEAETNESVDEDEEDAYERALNFECEMLRNKLAAKVSDNVKLSDKKVNNNQNEDTTQDNDMQDTDNNSHDNNSNNDSNDSNNSIYLEEPNNNNTDYYFDYDYSQKNNNSNDNNSNDNNNNDDDEDDEAIERENQLLRAAIEMKRKIIL